MWINNKWINVSNLSKEDNMTNNNVEHPKHYNREGGMECIDEMILVFGKEAVKSFCLCNAWKYRYRAADKNGEEDLKKSDWYLQKYKELNNEYSWGSIKSIPVSYQNIPLSGAKPDNQE